MLTDEQKALLAKPLSSGSVKSRQQSGRKFSYVEGWHVIAEANRIFGFDGWARQTLETKLVAERERTIGTPPSPGWGVTYIAKVRVAVGDVIRDGCGSGHGIDRDLGQAHESALKEAETDAMKRAFMTFGNQFGLALYDKEQAGVAAEPRVAPPPPPAPVARKPVAADKRLVQQAGICCADPLFHRFLWKNYDTRVVDEESATVYVRKHCGVPSRTSIIAGTPAAIRWNDMYTEFLLWKNIPAPRGEAETAAPATPNHPPGAANLSFEGMAREAAMRGRDVLRGFYKSQPLAGRMVLDGMKEELEKLIPEPGDSPPLYVMRPG